MRRIESRNSTEIKEVLRKEIRRNDDARYDHRPHAVLLAVDGRSPYAVTDLLGDSPRSVYNRALTAPGRIGWKGCAKKNDRDGPSDSLIGRSRPRRRIS